MTDKRLLILSILAGIVAMACVQVYSAQQKSAAQQTWGATGTILVAKQTIKSGEHFTATALETQTVPAPLINERMMRAEHEAYLTSGKGSVALRDIPEGTAIYWGDVQSTPSAAATGGTTGFNSVFNTGFNTELIPDGMRAVPVPIRPETAASNIVQPGDIVDIIAARQDDSSRESAQSAYVLEEIEVLSVGGSSTRGSSTATLLVTPDQALLLAGIMSHNNSWAGGLTLVLHGR